jgi:hypothetical protein
MSEEMVKEYNLEAYCSIGKRFGGVEPRIVGMGPVKQSRFKTSRFDN